MIALFFGTVMNSLFVWLLGLLTTRNGNRVVVDAVTNKPAATPDRPPIVLEALEKNETIYYFGLGSNMLRKKLENRGINGTKIDILSMEAAVVPNHRLAFNMRGFPPLEPGMGSLEPISEESKPLLAYDGGECHGALVKLTSENYEKVMRSEGVGSGNRDQGYEEIVVDAYPYKSPGKPVKAIALRAQPKVRLRYDPSPSMRYMNILKEGAKELGLSPCYQDFLARHPVEKVPNWLKRLSIYNFVFTASLSFKLKWRGLSRLQNRILYIFYVPPTVKRLKKFFSNLAMTMIILPGALAGLLALQFFKLTGETPPMIARMISLLSETGTPNESNQTKLE